MAIEIARDLRTINQELKMINTSFRSAQKEANSLQKALKLDPSNMKLVSARTTELQKQIDLASRKIDLLREAENRLIQQNGVEVKLTPQFQKLENEIAKTEATTKNLESQLDKTNKVDFSKLSSSLRTVAKVATGIVAGIAGIGVAYATQMDNIQKQVDHFGGTAEEWQLQSNAWDKLTGNSNAYASVLSAITSNMGQVQKESSRVGTVLAQLGLTFEDLKGHSSTEVLDIYLEALRNVSNESERMAIAVSLFGESAGVYISQMAGTSTEQINEWNDAMIEAGLATNEQVAAGAELQDTFDYLKQSLISLVATIGTSLKPAIEVIIGLLNQVAPIVNLIAQALSALGPSGTIAIGVFTGLISLLPALISLLAALHVGTGNIALAALTFGALAAVAGVGIGFGLNGSGLQETAEMTGSALETDLNEASNSGTTNGNSTTNNSTVINNNYYDNATYNNNVSSEVDVDSLIEEIADKKRVMIGG